jgi:hypothetical protein
MGSMIYHCWPHPFIHPSIHHVYHMVYEETKAKILPSLNLLCHNLKAYHSWMACSPSLRWTIILFFWKFHYEKGIFPTIAKDASIFLYKQIFLEVFFFNLFYFAKNDVVFVKPAIQLGYSSSTVVTRDIKPSWGLL